MGILSDRQIRAEIGITPFKDYGPKVPGTISSGLGSYGYDVRLGYKFKVFSPIHAKEIDPKNFDPKCLVDVDLTPGFSRDGKHVWNSRGPDGQRVGWSCKLCGFVPPEPYSAIVADEFRNNPCGAAVPKPAGRLLIPPHSFVLAESLERFKIPRDVLCVVVGKSTYARCGLIVNVTPGEPEWEGVWTIEISNTTPLPVRVYPGEGIMQAMFFRSDEKRMVANMELRQLIALTAPSSEVLLVDFIRRTQDASCERSYADKKGKYSGQNGLTLPIPEPADSEVDDNKNGGRR